MKAITIVSIFLIFLSLGCDQIVDYQLPVGDPVPVVNGFINPDSVFKINLTESRHVLDNSRTFNLFDADEVLIYNNGNIIGEALPDSQGNYVLENYYPQHGHSYKIEIYKSDYPTISASDILPASTPEFSILSYKLVREEYLPGHSFEIEIINPEGEAFFELIAFTYFYNFDWQPNGPPILVDSIYSPLFLYTKNPIANNSDEFGRESLLFTNSLINSATIKLDININNIPFRFDEEDSLATTVDLVVRRTSENYYRYKRSLRLHQEVSGDPLAEPVQVHNNIENGLGVFGSYVQSLQSYTIPYPSY